MSEDRQMESTAQESIKPSVGELSSGRRIPTATYRIQFNSDFTLSHADALVDYLHSLGASHIYASPLFTARKGSTHGYDVCDPTKISMVLGGEEALTILAERLRERGMGLLLDIVPNHMGINDPCNAWWTDVLENGPSSLYASFFDVAWEPSKPELRDRILLPVLEDQYGAVLEAGKLKLIFSDGAFSISYYDNLYPIAPGTYRPILEAWLARVREAGEEAAALELESVMTAVGYLPSRGERDMERRLERAREKEVIKRRLAALWQSSGTVFTALQETLAHFNGDPRDPRSFDPLDALLESQAYRLAYWRVAAEEINYRRFFDIRDLAAIRVEDPEVFRATHALALRLLAEGKITGLRIDHPDGLFHPAEYFCRLQEHYLTAALARDGEDARQAANAEAARWLEEQVGRASKGQGHDPWPLYVVAEKILSETEPLPLDWAVDGTTGYDFLASANAVQVNPANAQAFTRIYCDFTGEDADFEALTVRTQRLIMREALASEINELSHDLERVAERNRHTRDFTLNNLRDAVRALVASLQVYRTYIDPATGQVSQRDRRYIRQAIKKAQELVPYIDPSVFAFLQSTILLENHEQFREEDRPLLAQWVMKFQQMTGPVMAKGVEDTAFYRYNRLVSLNEVGGHPALFGIDVAQFHKDNTRRARHWPHSMLATSTHDNKRSEDVRARINVLSEMPGEWARCLEEWAGLNEGSKTPREESGELMPDRNDEYLLYQILLGAWPLAAAPSADSPWSILMPPDESDEFKSFAERIGRYMNKAVKEAKVHGSWTNPDEAYDAAVQQFVAALLAPDNGNRFLASFAPLAATVAFLGQFNALAQVALKLTSPGMPDIYQGNELWDFSLVDPDNRRPVDYERRRELLAGLPQDGAPHHRASQEAVAELLQNSHDGRIKLFVTAGLLRFRREHRALFESGAYRPLEVMGSRADHVIAFAREHEGQRIVVIVPRLVAGLSGARPGEAPKPPLGPVWGDTRVALRGERAGSTLTDVLTGQSVQGDSEGSLPVAAALASFPVAVLAG